MPGRLSLLNAGPQGAAVVAPTSLLTGLVAYWNLNEASGARADSLGVETLTDNATVTSQVGKQGNAAQFTAANLEYLSHADDAPLSLGAGVRMTLAGWFLFTSTTMALVGKWGGSGNFEYLLYLSSGGLVQFWVSRNGTNNDFIGDRVPTLNNWHFLVGRYDGVNLSCRVDAQPWQDLPYALDIFNGTSAFEIGRQAGIAYLNGAADEVGLWKRALTDAEVDLLYNGGAGTTYPFGGAPPFAPSDVANLKLWLEPGIEQYTDSTLTTLATTNGANVGGWKDQGGSGNHLTQPSAAKLQTLNTNLVNGYPGVKFDGVDDCLFTTAASGLAAASTQFTVFVVLKTGALGTQAFLQAGANGGTNGKVFRLKDSGGQLEFLKANTASLGASSGVLAANTAYVVAFDYNSPNGTYYINGVAAGSVSSAQVFAGAPVTGVYVGAQDNAGVTPFPGQVLEVVYYDTQISTGDLASVHSYLGAKYGLF